MNRYKKGNENVISDGSKVVVPESTALVIIQDEVCENIGRDIDKARRGDWSDDDD